MERLDKNLWYRVKRFHPQPNLMYPPITDQYRKTGKFSHEASTQPFAKLVSGTGDDKNVSFQLPRNNLQPILPQRAFRDLDPQTRVRGGLDLTKGERQQTKIIKALEGTSDLISDFLSTPKKNADGTIKLDPTTNLPIMEIRSLAEILAVSQQALFKALKDQNVAPTRNVTLIINSFTSVQIQNVLAKFRGIMREFPAITAEDKSKAFSAAILDERMRDLTSAPDGVEDAIGDELVEEKMTDFEDDWNIPYTADMFPRMGFTPTQWHSGYEAQKNVTEYVLARLKRNPDERVKTINGSEIRVEDMARQFAKDRNHIFNLRTLQFVRPPPYDIGRILMGVKHT